MKYATVLSRVVVLVEEGEIFISGERESKKQKSRMIREFSAFEPERVAVPVIPRDTLLLWALGVAA